MFKNLLLAALIISCALPAWETRRSHILSDVPEDTDVFMC
jgi:hypothetical protein